MRRDRQPAALARQTGRDLAHACSQEVVDLHHFLASWLRGEPSRSREGIARLEGALAKSFAVVYPTGTMDDRAGVVDSFWQAHGSRPDSFRIAVRARTVRYVQWPSCLISYEEWHHDRAESTGRISTAVLRMRRDGCFEWLHLHETHLPYPDPRNSEIAEIVAG